MHPEPISAVLTLNVTVDAKALRVVYTLKNNEDNELVLFNRPRYHAQDGSVAFYAVSYISKSDSTLLLQSRALEPPENLQVAETVTPAVMRVAPGALFSESQQLLFPLRACHPFRKVELEMTAGAGVDAVPSAPSELHLLSFELGVGRLQDAAHVKRISAAHPEIWHLKRPGTSPQQVFRKELKLARPVELLDYALVKRDAAVE